MLTIIEIVCFIIILPNRFAEEVSYHFVNDTAILHCQQLPNNKMVWYGPPNFHIYAIGDQISTQLSKSKSDRLSIVHNDSSQYNLKIRYFSIEDEGQYKCYISGSQANASEIFFRLTKAEAPRNITIKNEESNHTVYGYLNKPLTLTCNVIQGVPKEKLLWVTSNITLSEAETASLIYNFKPTKEDHLKQFTCTTKRYITDFSLQRTVQLFVHMPPYVWISPIQKPVILEEGDDLTIYCNYSSNTNITDLKWKRLLPTKSQPMTTQSSPEQVFKNIQRDIAGRYACTVSNIAGSGSDSVTIQVNYPPTITVTFVEQESHRRLHCKPFGIPDMYTFKQWEHRTEYLELIRRLPNNGSNVLNLQSITGETERHHDRGIYVCQASNNVSMNGNVYTSGDFFLQAEGKPYFVTSNNKTQYGQIGNMNCLTVEVVSFPELTNLSINSDVMQDSNVNYTVEDVKVFDIVYNKKVLVNGSRLTIPVNVKTAKYFRKYTVKVFNQHGSSSFNVTLRSASSPKKPTILEIIPRKSQVILKWRAGFNGGFEQTFIIEYRRLDVQYWNTIPVKDNTIHTYSINGLTPGTEYLIRLHSINTKGSSGLSKEFLTTTDDTNENINFGFLLLIVPFLIAAAVFYWQCKKGNLRPLQRISCCKWQPFIDAGGIGAVENNFYENQNNEVQNAIGNNMDMPIYNSIERRAHLSIGQCVSYSATPKRKPNPLGQRKNDIACSGASFGSSGTSEPKCPNDLNYIDVCFEPKPSGHKFQIHGSDNKTDYVDIDFSKRICSFAESERNSDDDFSSIDDIRMMKKEQEKVQK